MKYLGAIILMVCFSFNALSQTQARNHIKTNHKSYKPAERFYVDNGAVLINGSYHGDVYVATGGVVILKGSNTTAYIEKGATVVLEDGLDQKVYFEPGAIIVNRNPYKSNLFYRVDGVQNTDAAITAIEE